MGGLRGYRVGLALLGLAIILGVLVAYRLKDQQARAVQRPRGGLAVSTVLTLILIPTLYVMLEARFPRRVPEPSGAPTPQGEIA